MKNKFLLFAGMASLMAYMPSAYADELEDYLAEEEASYQKELAKDKADTTDHRDQKFVDINLFNDHFQSLNNQYDKDWALAATVHYCALQPALSALKNGANINTEVEFARNFPDSHSVDQWMFINGEDWEKDVEFSLDTHIKYLPRHHPITDRSCDCMLAAESQGKTDITLMALACGDEFSRPFLSDINIDINALLIKAVQLGYADAINVLLEKGADINAPDESGKTALYYALLSDRGVKYQDGYLSLASYLVKKQADIKGIEATSLLDKVIAAFLGEGYHFETVDPNSRNILFYVIDKGNFELFKLLSEYGADENATDKSGLSLLEYAKRQSENFESRQIYHYLLNKKKNANPAIDSQVDLDVYEDNDNEYKIDLDFSAKEDNEDIIELDIIDEDVMEDEIKEKIEAISANDLQKLAQKIFTSTPAYALLGCQGKKYPSYDKVKKLLA